MITLPRMFRIDTDEQQAAWSVKVNEFIKDAILGLTQVNKQAVYLSVPFVGGQTDVRVQTTFSFPVRGAIVINVLAEDESLTPGAVWIQTRFEGGRLVIRQATGLTAGVSYTLTLQVIGA